MLFLLSFGTQAQSDSGSYLKTAQKAITAANKRFFTDVLKNDGSIANHYTDDAWIMVSYNILLLPLNRSST